LGVALVMTACGDDDDGGGGTITTAASTTVPSTSGETSTTVATSTTIDTGPLAGLVGLPVQDTLLDTGFHEMQYVDDAHSYLVSVDSLTGGDPAVDRLAVGVLAPPPTTSGIAGDQILAAVWVDNWAGDIAPTGIALYTVGVAGWTAIASIEDDEILGFLDTTTDYTARRPDGPPVLQAVYSQFDWTGSAHFLAGVSVFDLFIPDAAAEFEGQIECTVDPALACTLLTDDGVLRPGDTGDAVTQLQQWLVSIDWGPGMGYLLETTGTYDADTEAAVRLFQRDFRLAVDGRAGPQTLSLLERVADASSGILLASEFGVAVQTSAAHPSAGTIHFGMGSLPAWLALIELLGTPVDTGWYTDACDGAQWYKSTWNGFTAIFTDRNGSRQFDGWIVTDLSTVPSNLYFVGGLRPGSTWGYVSGLGAVYNGEEAYGGFFELFDLGYNNGRLVVTPPTPTEPANSAVVRSFGTGTGAFVSC
jgi:hypothetical protein